MSAPTAHAIRTYTHGRYLVREPRQPGPAPMLVGFHGYAESAETQLDRLATVAGSERWRIVSIQGLHRFYRSRSQEVVASWMTRQDRDLALSDNTAFVAAVLDAVQAAARVPGAPMAADPLPTVFAGFSQGVAMAFRAACYLSDPTRSGPAGKRIGIIALGGDVPPELDRHALAPISAVLLGRGARDEWYTDETWRSDDERLRQAGLMIEAMLLDAAHEWTDEFARAAAGFLDRMAE